MEHKEEVKKRALNFLKSNHVGVIATSNLNSEPSASIVYFVVKDDFTIYFGTSHNTNKFKNITLNNKVAFSAGSGDKYTSVQIKGVASFLYNKDQEEGLALFDTIKNEHPPEKWPINVISKLREGGFVLVKIVPKEVMFLDMDNTELSTNLFQVFP